MDLYCLEPVEINIHWCLFICVRSFFTCSLIHGGRLFDLRCTMHGRNRDITRLRLPGNLDHASPNYELAFTDHFNLCLIVIQNKVIRWSGRSTMDDIKYKCTTFKSGFTIADFRSYIMIFTKVWTFTSLVTQAKNLPHFLPPFLSVLIWLYTNNSGVTPEF